MIASSKRTGRLSTYPQFDDVAYLDDGLRRLRILHEHGCSALAADYRLWPPHAPMSTALAFGAFEVCGPRDWAPYAADGLLVFGYLLLGSSLLRGVRLWQMLIVLALLACVPMSLLAVTEFRPDFAASLLTVAGMVILLLPACFGDRLRANLAAGACFGLSALAKPTFVPVIIFFLLVCLPLSSISRAIISRRRVFVRGTLTTWGISLIPAILIPLPHYLIAWRDIAGYIYDVQFGAQRDVWAVKGSWLFHLSYFLIGPGGREMLGGFVLIISIVLVAGAIAILRRNRRRDLALFVLGPAMIFTFLIPSLNRHKQPSFGLMFQLLMVFTALLVVRRMLLTLKHNHERIVAAALLLLLVVRVYEETRARAIARQEQVVLHNRAEIVQGVYHALASLNQPSGQPESVVLTGIGDLNADLLSYLALKDDHDFNCYTPSINPDRDRFDVAFDQCDAVVAADGRSDMFQHLFASDAIQDALRNELITRPDFRLLAKFREKNTESDVYVFQHIRVSSAKL